MISPGAAAPSRSGNIRPERARNRHESALARLADDLRQKASAIRSEGVFGRRYGWRGVENPAKQTSHTGKAAPKGARIARRRWRRTRLDARAGHGSGALREERAQAFQQSGPLLGLPERGEKTLRPTVD